MYMGVFTEPMSGISTAWGWNPIASYSRKVYWQVARNKHTSIQSPNIKTWWWPTLMNKVSEYVTSMTPTLYNYFYFGKLNKFYNVITFSNITFNHWLPHIISVLVVIMRNHDFNIIVNSKHSTDFIFFVDFNEVLVIFFRM